jgi:hypothetical protein
MLTSKTYSRLKQMLTRKVLADEFQALLSVRGMPSKKLQGAIRAAMANKAAANEIIHALQVSSPNSLSGRSTRDNASPNAARRLRDALASKAADAEIEALL